MPLDLSHGKHPTALDYMKGESIVRRWLGAAKAASKSSRAQEECAYLLWLLAFHGEGNKA